MWEMMSNMMPTMNQMIPKRRNRGMNTATAMLIGAGVGIATWEMMRRNNLTNQVMGGNAEGQNQGNAGISDAAITQMADEVMNAIQ